MNAIILACGSLISHVDAAQKKMKTNYPVIDVDRKYHDDPRQMREQLINILQNLPDETDTVLAAMGLCGSSWESISTQKRIVIPRVDDCITLLLHTDNTWYPNLKKGGHLYLRDSDTEEYSLTGMRQRLCEEYGEEDGSFVFQSMFTNYTNVDIIDTGVYDCHAKEYVAEAQKNAALIECSLDYVPGSNLLLEKLVSGQWDHQFIVAGPGQMLAGKDFLP